jgi:hypothetical protein
VVLLPHRSTRTPTPQMAIPRRRRLQRIPRNPQRRNKLHPQNPPQRPILLHERRTPKRQTQHPPNRNPPNLLRMQKTKTRTHRNLNHQRKSRSRSWKGRGRTFSFLARFPCCPFSLFPRPHTRPQQQKHAERRHDPLPRRRPLGFPKQMRIMQGQELRNLGRMPKTETTRKR